MPTRTTDKEIEMSLQLFMLGLTVKEMAKS
jgi:hypothetical protein